MKHLKLFEAYTSENINDDDHLEVETDSILDSNGKEDIDDDGHRPDTSDKE